MRGNLLAAAEHRGDRGGAFPEEMARAIVIEGLREDWPGGGRTLMPRDAFREHNGKTFWFGADLAPDGSQLWFRISSEAVRRMREQTPRARGDALVDALLAWVTPDRPLRRELNRFEVRVSDDGDAWIERLRW